MGIIKYAIHNNVLLPLQLSSLMIQLTFVLKTVQTTLMEIYQQRSVFIFAQFHKEHLLMKILECVKINAKLGFMQILRQGVALLHVLRFLPFMENSLKKYVCLNVTLDFMPIMHQENVRQVVLMGLMLITQQ